MAKQQVPSDAGSTTTAAPMSTANTDWSAIERDPNFQALVQTKRAFIVPATIFFLVYYFAFLVLVGYFPDLVSTNVIGNVNVAYLLALSQFVMVWVLMALYIRRAGGFDTLASSILTKVRGLKR